MAGNATGDYSVVVTTEPAAAGTPPGYKIGSFLLPFTPKFACNAAIVVASLLLNSLTLAGLRRDSRLRAVTYNYVSSLCSAMLLQCLVCCPPQVIQEIIGPGHTGLLNTLCIAWIYLDTFLCNLVFLHCLGSTIDTWLRLRYPMRYTYSTTRGSTCLKLGAPWSVSFIQTTAEFAVSKQHDGLYHSGAGVCLHKDPNFVILRACMSYALPGLASFVMLGLGFCQLSAVRGQQDPELVSELIRSYHKQQRSDTASCSSNGISVADTNGVGVLELDDSRTLSAGSSNSRTVLQHHQQQQLARDATRETLLLPPPSLTAVGGISRDAVSAFELCRMTPIPEAPEENGSSCNVTSSRSCHTFKPPATNTGGSNSSSSNNSSFLLSPSAYALTELQSGLSTCPVHRGAVHHLQRHHQQLQQLQQLQLHQQAADEIPSSAFAYDEQLRQQSPSFEQQQQQQQQQQHQQSHRHSQRRLNNSWRRMLRTEKSACRLNLCAFLVSLVFWSPYTLSSLLHCVCASFPCPASLPPSAANIGDMKWIAYAACVAFPVFFLFADADIRRAAACRGGGDGAEALVYGPTAATGEDPGGDDDRDSCTLADSQA